jgi:hypothetical protein
VSPANAVQITESGVGDAPMLPGLLAQISNGEQVASVTADGACDGVRRRARTGGGRRLACRDAIAARGADALAIVLEPMAHKARSRPGASMSHVAPSVRATMANAVEEGRFRRGGETRPCAPSDAPAARSGAAGAATIAAAASRRGEDELHEPARSEARRRSASAPDRRTLGPNRRRGNGRPARCRTFDRQTAELQLRIAILNRFTALGIPVTQPVGRRQMGKGAG